MTPTFTTAAGLLGSWLTDVETGKPPPRYAVAAPFDSLDLQPGRLIMIGGAPGAGKSAALLQIVVDLLRLNVTARVMLANIEMSAQMLLERIVARAACVPLSKLAERQMTDEQRSRVRMAAAALEPVWGRLAFLGQPCTLQHLAAAADEFGAGVLIVDYVQRFVSESDKGGRREALEDVAGILRRLCDAGGCVLAAAAVSRNKDFRGSTYAGLGLASFRGSSELEYSADACYLAVPDGEAGTVQFLNPKQRYGKPTDILTRFDSDLMMFAAPPAGLAAFDEAKAAAPLKAGGNKHRAKGSE